MIRKLFKKMTYFYNNSSSSPTSVNLGIPGTVSLGSPHSHTISTGPNGITGITGITTSYGAAAQSTSMISSELEFLYKHLSKESGKDFKGDIIFVSQYKVKVKDVYRHPYYEFSDNSLFYYELWKKIFAESYTDHSIVIIPNNTNSAIFDINICFSSKDSLDHYEKWVNDIKNRFFTGTLKESSLASYMPSLETGHINGEIIQRYVLLDANYVESTGYLGVKSRAFNEDLLLMEWASHNCSESFFVFGNFLIFKSVTDAISYKVRFS